MTHRYQTLEGRSTHKNDPKRGVWYASNTDWCGYWTDEWTMLRLVGPGIPACPHCGCVGLQTTYGSWIKDATNFETDGGHPRYVEFLLTRRNVCSRSLPPVHPAGGGGRAVPEPFMAAYRRFVASPPA